MAEAFLIGEKNTYYYNPENKEDVIKEKGKFGSVYIGRTRASYKKVIIKKLNQSQNSEISRLSEIHAILSGIKYHGLATPIDLIHQDDRYFLVSEYIEGIDLQNVIKHKRLRKLLDLKLILEIFIELLESLEILHQHSIIHCDIRPSNIILENFPDSVNPTEFRIKIIDFGLARKTDQIDKPAPFSLIYSPPEQVLNYSNIINNSSDLYAAGITLYEILTCKKPFYHDNPEILMNLQIVLPLPKNPKIPEPLYRILLKATNKFRFLKPSSRYSHKEVKSMLIEGQMGRYQTAIEFKDALTEYYNNNSADFENPSFFKRFLKYLI